MSSQADLKRVRSLQQKKNRTTSQRLLVQGRKVVAELLASSWQTEALYASAEAAEWIHEAATRRQVPVHVLPAHQLEKIGTLENGNELVAVAVAPEPPEFLAPAAGDLLLALDGVRDPRNLGGLLRIADWFGVPRVLCSLDCMEAHNPKVVQSTMGSLFRIPVRYVDLVEELRRYASKGAQVYFADMDGTPVFDVPLSRPAVLVLGSESHGLSQSLGSVNATVIAVPRVGGAESLNVAMAAASLCTEFTRPRQLPPPLPRLPSG